MGLELNINSKKLLRVILLQDKTILEIKEPMYC